MKILFVTGGSISGLGKGITSASIGKLISSAGYTVAMIKMDPYLQVDAGTISPYEHGEVFVTEDGGETDLDLGNYERFINANVSKHNNITTGKVYLNVIKKERRGDYLGKTVQIIPHVTNEIKDNVLAVAKDVDVTIVEVGGTVGDIESQPFLEAIRQMKHDLGAENVMYVHVALLLYLGFSGEMKTKLIQHSVIKLREYGILPNIIICRSEQEVTEHIKTKISRLCDVSMDNIIEAINVDTIYEIPEKFRHQNLDTIIFDHFQMKRKKVDLKQWNANVATVLNPSNTMTVGIVGKYVEFEDTYKSINEALIHAGVANNTKVKLNWIPSESLENKFFVETLENFRTKGELDAILIPGGFGERGVEGKINAAGYARENKIPYLGICLGMQVAIIEYARRVCGLKKANSTEFVSKTKDPVIDYIEEQKSITDMGGTMRLGGYEAVLKKGSHVEKLYKKSKVSERHRHRYEVNPDYHKTLQSNGLVFSGMSADRVLVEFIELTDHPYFVATQAHPEFQSKLDAPHPLFVGLVEAGLKT